ncbi:hypothetical protein QC762_106014 [Podospora pseudocomata]|uniref:Uncharacterized protein n=1 Tax=Podospora pseudocomata TaxID=2093779 RepID=A0ABR0GTE2_9PEZI|nr:hypothetical protein QC762_106014 [Podospora pseudocomata]
MNKQQFQGHASGNIFGPGPTFTRPPPTSPKAISRSNRNPSINGTGTNIATDLNTPPVLSHPPPAAPRAMLNLRRDPPIAPLHTKITILKDALLQEQRCLRILRSNIRRLPPWILRRKEEECLGRIDRDEARLMELQEEARLRGLESVAIHSTRQGGAASSRDGNFEGDSGWVGRRVMTERLRSLGPRVEEEQEEKTAEMDRKYSRVLRRMERWDAKWEREDRKERRRQEAEREFFRRFEY